MTIKYVYKEKEYNLVRDLIQDIWNDSHVLIKIPTENEEAFWEQYGVTYIEEPDPEPTLEELKTLKLNDLENAFLAWYEQGATLISSLGFECDSDARAKMDVDSLVTKAQAEGIETYSTVFMDAKNQPHAIGFEELKTIQLEIIDAGLAVYNQKWTMRSAINEAETKEDLEAIEIEFTVVDFSGVSEDAV